MSCLTERSCQLLPTPAGLTASTPVCLFSVLLWRLTANCFSFVQNTAALTVSHVVTVMFTVFNDIVVKDGYFLSFYICTFETENWFWSPVGQVRDYLGVCSWYIWGSINVIYHLFLISSHPFNSSQRCNNFNTSDRKYNQGVWQRFTFNWHQKMQCNYFCRGSLRIQVGRSIRMSHITCFPYFPVIMLS